jgi:hypothetical protein
MQRFPRKLVAFAVVTAALLVATCTGIAFTESLPSWTALLVMGCAAILAAQRQVKVASVSVSPSFMVAMAAIVVFHHDGSIVAAALVGALTQLRFEHFARGRWGWLPFNLSITGLAFLAAAAAYSGVANALPSTMPIALVGIVIASAAYLVVAVTLIVASYLVEGVASWREPFEAVLPFALQVLPFAIVGFLLGRLYLSFGAVALLLIIVPMLIAREMFASYMKVKESHEETVGMLVRALEAKDRYTAGHAERVATYARYVGEELHFMPARLDRLRFAALMHDIGKLVVPNFLLNKPGRLTAEEFARVRIHEKVSVQMLSHIDFLRPIAAVSDPEHTRFDPDDPDHPIEPYIVMVADAYDAMTSTRAYRKALPQDVAFQELRDKAGVQFHPECVEALVHAIEQRGEAHGAGYEEGTEFVDAPATGLGSAGLGDLLDAEKK